MGLYDKISEKKKENRKKSGKPQGKEPRGHEKHQNVGSEKSVGMNPGSDAAPGKIPQAILDRFEQQVLCWGATCSNAHKRICEDGRPEIVCLRAPHAAQIVSLKMCPLGRWEVVPPGENGAVGYIILGNYKQKRGKDGNNKRKS